MHMKNALQEKEWSILKIFAYLGLFFGIGADIIWVAWPFTGLAGHTGTIKIITLLVQTLTAILFTLGFAWVYIRIRVNVWLALLVGALLGAICTALAFGLSSGTYMTMAVHAGALTVNQPELKSLPAHTLFSQMFMHGAIFGFFVGLLPGALAGAIISLNLGTKSEEQ